MSQNVHHTLQYYVNNSDKYFTSHTQIQLEPGQHHLSTDLLLRNVTDISFIGMNPCHIIFTASASVSVLNAIVLNLKNIKLKFENNWNI